MPTYLYKCEQCHQEYEVVHSIKEELTECPKCKEKGWTSAPPTRLISKTSFILVGGGWSGEGYAKR